MAMKLLLINGSDDVGDGGGSDVSDDEDDRR